MGNYKGRKDKRQAVMNNITSENYVDMKERVKRLSDVDTEKNSSNIGRFLEYFESANDSWIEKINNKLA